MEKLKTNVINIYPMFDTDGGTHKDLLIINLENISNIVVNLPFFEKEIDFV